MSNVLLISSNLFKNPYHVYPLGMAVIASALSQRGHAVRQFDSIVGDNLEERLKEAITGFAPDFVGISLRNIDSVDSMSGDGSWCLANDKRLVSIIRQSTEAPVILGGAGFSALPVEILDYVGADYGIVGEGERLICDLIDEIKNGQAVRRSVKYADIPLKGEEMKAPLWEKDLIEFYVTRSGMVNLQTKRGCPYNCSYCVYPSLEGKRFRFREPEAVIDDLERLAGYNVDTVFFTDSVFNDHDGHYLDLVELIIRSGLKIRWAAYFRPDGIGYRELVQMKRSGLYAMEVGTDAGCDETLACMNKGFNFSDVLKFNSACIKAEIPSAHFFIFGGPGETERTLKEGMKNIGLLKKTVVFAYSGVRILPGAGIYRRAIEEGMLSENESLLRPVFYFSPLIDVEGMNRTIERISKRHRGFIFPPEKGNAMISAMNALGLKGLLWDRMISFSNDNNGRRRKI
ncbi:MAG: cobalamin-dependent protein [Deltaproteobacteria bacterium]|nr:cobalamin-dependent protein [Deltaproteobacteria bacterium]